MFGISVFLLYVFWYNASLLFAWSENLLVQCRWQLKSFGEEVEVEIRELVVAVLKVVKSRNLRTVTVEREIVIRHLGEP